MIFFWCSFTYKRNLVVFVAMDTKIVLHPVQCPMIADNNDNVCISPVLFGLFLRCDVCVRVTSFHLHLRLKTKINGDKEEDGMKQQKRLNSVHTTKTEFYSFWQEVKLNDTMTSLALKCSTKRKKQKMLLSATYRHLAYLDFIVALKFTPIFHFIKK